MKSWLPFLAAGIVACTMRAAGAENGKVSLIEINGAIGPSTAGYVSRAIEVATAANARCLVIQLDTPGGLLDSTKQIVQAFYGSKVPVVVYVAPAGANAGSAGCFITLAADVATMAPNTSIGAAHPVEFGGGGLAEKKGDDVMTKKLENFAVSYIEAIAEKRGRNVEWAKSAVRESASVTAEKALELQVVDLIAQDVPDLLRRINGREASGRVLRTADAQVERIPMVARERVFQTLWRPEVIFILMLVAIYGIIGELSNPGAILPGVVGLIALIVALYMASVLPVNIAGLALILLAVALFITDAFVASHGILSIGGVVSFFLGSLLLFDRAGPAFRLSLVMIVPATVVTALFFLFVVGVGLRAQRLPHRTGTEAMIGRIVAALTPIDAHGGKVFVEGETWNARSESPVEKDQPVEIVGIRGLTLNVKART
ncbi:MAG: NfeD family protein [Opitutaceae bacterium]